MLQLGQRPGRRAIRLLCCDGRSCIQFAALECAETSPHVIADDNSPHRLHQYRCKLLFYIAWLGKRARSGISYIIKFLTVVSVVSFMFAGSYMRTAFDGRCNRVQQALQRRPRRHRKSPLIASAASSILLGLGISFALSLHCRHKGRILFLLILVECWLLRAAFIDVTNYDGPDNLPGSLDMQNTTCS